MLDIRCQLIKTERPLVYKFFIIQVFIDQHAHDGQSQRTIRARANGNPLSTGAFGCLRITRIDHHDVTTAFRRRFKTSHIQWRGVGSRIRPPNNQQLCIFHVGVHIDQHAAKSHIGRDHGKRHITQRTHAHGVG